MHWILHKSQSREPLTRDEALAVLRLPPDDMPVLMYAASETRKSRFGNSVILCSILNARCGACSEDCAFCAQSAHHKTEVQSFPMIPAEAISVAAKSAAGNPIKHFGVVTSGGSLDDQDIHTVCSAIDGVKAAGVTPCASLGMLDDAHLSALKEAGLVRYHHNLETAAGYYPQICTTHSFEDRIETVRRAKRAGLEVCSGGILGMGETLEHRVDLAFTLHHEGVNSIPLNFLVPIPGTRLEGQERMKPLEILKTIAMFRLTNRDAEIKVCAGRESGMRDLQSMFFYAGATGIMVGNYLTVAGRALEDDIQMLTDLEVDCDRT